MLRAGASGCLVKPFHDAQCLATLRCVPARTDRVRSERTLLPGGVVQAGGSADKHTPQLTAREARVLADLAEGYLYKEIQDHLRISPALLKKTQHAMFVKLGAGNRTEAVNEWRRLQVKAGSEG